MIMRAGCSHLNSNQHAPHARPMRTRGWWVEGWLASWRCSLPLRISCTPATYEAVGCSSVLRPEARLPRLAVLLATLASAGSGAVPGRLLPPPPCAAVEALLPGRLLLLGRPEATEAGRLPPLDATAGDCGERQRAGMLGELRQAARRPWQGEEARMAGLVGEHCRKGGEQKQITGSDREASAITVSGHSFTQQASWRARAPEHPLTAEVGKLVGELPPAAAAAAAASSRALSSCATDRREGLEATAGLPLPLPLPLVRPLDRGLLLSSLWLLMSCWVLLTSSLLSAATAVAASAAAGTAASTCCPLLRAERTAASSLLPSTWVLLPLLAPAASPAPISTAPVGGAAGTSSTAASARLAADAAASSSAGSSSAAGSELPLSSRSGRSDRLRLGSAANRLGLRQSAGSSLLLQPLLGAARLPEAALSWAAESRLASLGAAGGGATVPAGAAAAPPSLGGGIGSLGSATAAGSIAVGWRSARPARRGGWGTG